MLSITLNLGDTRGVEIAKKLISRADIVVENFSGGTLKRMGLGYEELKKIKPDIIMLSSCMQGQTGPHAKHRGIGAQLAALCGFNQIAGWPDHDPTELRVYTDFIGPRFNTFIIMAALDYRNRTGKGMYIDASQYECGVQFMTPLIMDYLVNGRIAGRMGNRYSHAAPHNAYRCRGDDKWCAIAVFTDEEWKNFCNTIGNPVWTKKPEFASLASRKENEDKLDSLVEEWTITRSPEEVMRAMQDAGIPAGMLQNGQEVLEEDPQLKHRHFFWKLNHPEIREYYAYRPSFILTKSTCELSSAPILGEHNEYVLKKLIDMSDEEYTILINDGVIEK